jgi:hypothetical protein
VNVKGVTLPGISFVAAASCEMELLFDEAGLQHTLESRVRVDARFGASDGGLVCQRICELLAADNLGVVAQLRTLDLRPLDSSAGCFSAQLTPRLRLRFEVVLESAPRVRGDGQIDLAQVHAIRIVGIEQTL